MPSGVSIAWGRSPMSTSTRSCKATVNAVRRNRRHVRYPRRAGGFAMLTETPRRMTETIFSGVTPRVGKR